MPLFRFYAIACYLIGWRDTLCPPGNPQPTSSQIFFNFFLEFFIFHFSLGGYLVLDTFISHFKAISRHFSHWVILFII